MMTQKHVGQRLNLNKSLLSTSVRFIEANKPQKKITLKSTSHLTL